MARAPGWHAQIEKCKQSHVALKCALLALCSHKITCSLLYLLVAFFASLNVAYQWIHIIHIYIYISLLKFITIYCLRPGYHNYHSLKPICCYVLIWLFSTSRDTHVVLCGACLTWTSQSITIQINITIYYIDIFVQSRSDNAPVVKKVFTMQRAGFLPQWCRLWLACLLYYFLVGRRWVHAALTSTWICRWS